MNDIKKIVLTGGPCAGKTTALVRILEHFTSLGYKVFTLPEIPTMMSTAGMNYLTDNKDDHCKNFSFIVLKDRNGSWKWHLAPAYDLTLCTEGYNGEHATSVNGTGHPTLKDFIAVGTKIKMNEQRCREIIEEVRLGCDDIARYHIKT